MVIAVIVAVAIPIVRYYFGDQLFRTFGRNREKLVSLVAQERKQTIPNQWFDREGGGPNRPPGPPTGNGPGAGPDASPGGNPPEQPPPSLGNGPSPADGPNVPNFPSPGANSPGKAPSRDGSTSSSDARSSTSNAQDDLDSGDAKQEPRSPGAPTDSKTAAQETFFQKVGGDGQSIEPNSIAASIHAQKARVNSADDPKLGADSVRDNRAAGGRPGGGAPSGKGKWNWWFLLRIMLLLILILIVLYAAFTSLRRR